MMKPKKQNPREKGQSMAEFGMGIVFIFIIIAGIVDTSRALFTYMAIRDSAQEGALYGSTNPTDSAGIQTHVQYSSDLLNSLMTSAIANVQVTSSTIGPACTGGAIRVRVSYSNFPITTPFLGSILGRQTIPISAEITDTILNPVDCP